jgi:hypothetical protein
MKYSDIQQLTPEDVANYELPIPEGYYDDGNDVAYTAGHQRGFVVGANWQKEQLKEVINALKELVECDYTSGTHLSCALIRGKNALRSICEPFQA